MGVEAGEVSDPDHRASWAGLTSQQARRWRERLRETEGEAETVQQRDEEMREADVKE